LTLYNGPLPAAKTTLADVVEDTGARTIHYLDDVGDGWDHAVRIERIGEPDPQALYPQLLAASAAAGPRTWAGLGATPISWSIPDVDRIAEELDHLARRWAPRPRKPKTNSLRHERRS
jgi:hypothetical protein